MSYSSVIIYGHPLHSHTHSYIHQAFYKAFKYLGYNVYWISSPEEAEGLSLGTNPLFLTEGQVDATIPMVPQATYLLHNCNSERYKEAGVSKLYTLQVITESSLKTYKNEPLQEYGFKHGDDLLYLAWATDLLPFEVDKNIRNLRAILEKRKESNEMHFVGMPTHIWDDVLEWCRENNIVYQRHGGFGDTNVDSETHIDLIQRSVVAPSVQESWQVENGYIPCRIFKNISYGHMGVTNNRFVNELFEGKLLYNTDVKALLSEALSFNDTERLIELMEFVRDKHTYVNRVKLLMEFLGH